MLSLRCHMTWQQILLSCLKTYFCFSRIIQIILLASKRCAQTRGTASVTSTEKFWAFSYKQRKPWRRMTIAQKPNRSDKQGLTALQHCYSYNTGRQPNPISLIQKQKVKQLSARSREIRRILESLCRHCIFRLYFPFHLLCSQSSLNSSLDGIPSPLF